MVYYIRIANSFSFPLYQCKKGEIHVTNYVNKENGKQNNDKIKYSQEFVSLTSQ